MDGITESMDRSLSELWGKTCIPDMSARETGRQAPEAQVIPDISELLSLWQQLTHFIPKSACVPPPPREQMGLESSLTGALHHRKQGSWLH